MNNRTLSIHIANFSTQSGMADVYDHHFHIRDCSVSQLKIVGFYNVQMTVLHHIQYKDIFII